LLYWPDLHLDWKRLVTANRLVFAVLLPFCCSSMQAITAQRTTHGMNVGCRLTPFPLCG
jgi:hypothetical protein